MVVVEYNQTSTVVTSQLTDDFRKHINTYVAEEHRLNGWHVSPPYFQDQSRDRVGPPSYPATRSIRPRPSGLKPQIHILKLEVVQENCTNPECTAKRGEDPQSEKTCTHEDLLFQDRS
jgi:hypothetical protein